MNKEVFFERIGKIIITKRKGSKRMTLSVRPFRPVRLTIPYYQSFSSAAKFIKEKEEWIIKSLEKISYTENKQSQFNLNTEFKTKYRALKFKKFYKEQIKISKNSIIVYYTDNTEILSDEFQAFIRKGIIETLRIEAKTYLPKRVSYWAEKFGLNYQKLSVRNAKTRWGSCSGNNNISLNIHLMRLPGHLADYVIQHELCHTVEKNHGPGFWKMLLKINPNAKTLDKELRHYSPEIL